MLSLHLMPQKKNESLTVSAQKGESSGFCQDSHAKLLWVLGPIWLNASFAKTPTGEGFVTNAVERHDPHAMHWKLAKLQGYSKGDFVQVSEECKPPCRHCNESTLRNGGTQSNNKLASWPHLNSSSGWHFKSSKRYWGDELFPGDMALHLWNPVHCQDI